MFVYLDILLDLSLAVQVHVYSLHYYVENMHAVQLQFLAYTCTNVHDRVFHACVFMSYT